MSEEDGEGAADFFSELDPENDADLEILSVYFFWILGTVVLLITVFIVRSRLARLRTSLNRFGKLASTEALFENLQRARGGPSWMQLAVLEEVENSLKITNLVQEQRKQEWNARGEGPRLADGTHTGRPAHPSGDWANAGRSARPTRDGPTIRPGASGAGFVKLSRTSATSLAAAEQVSVIRSRQGDASPSQLQQRQLPSDSSDTSFASSRYESATRQPRVAELDTVLDPPVYESANGGGDTSITDFAEPGGSPLIHAKQTVRRLPSIAVDGDDATSPSGGSYVELEPEPRSPVETDSFI